MTELKLISPNDAMGKAIRQMAKSGAKGLKRDRVQANERIRRQDSTFAGSNGLHLSRDLEYIYGETIKDDYPDNRALELFPIDQSVPPGAKTHTVRRLTGQGRMEIHRGRADDLPTVSLSQVEETFPVHYYVTSVVYDHFEQLASGYANSNMIAESMAEARNISLEFLNELTWDGSDVNDIYGVLNYPFLNKFVSSAVFRYGGDAKAMLTALQRIVDFPKQLAKGKAVLRPNTMVVSNVILDIITGTYFEGTNETVLQRLEASKGIKVEEASELAGKGPGGTDAILVYKKGDKQSVANVVPMPFSTMPLQQQGFEYIIPCFMSHGGVIMRKPLMNVLAYVTVEDDL